MHKIILAATAVLAVLDGLALDADAFARPSAARHPETWFHLIGGNVAKTGLDADLDAVKAAGISGIQLFHGQFGGPWPGVSPQIPCLSADWDDLIRHVADGCAKRGLGFKMQNCPGWSMSGGPWITPDLAMRNLTYSRTVVAAGAAAPLALPRPTWQPETNLSEKDLDYRDLFVLAFPTPQGGDQEMETPKPMRQRDEKGVLVRTFTFAQPKTVRAIEIPSPSRMNHGNSYTPDARVELFAVAEDGTKTSVLNRPVPQGVWQDGVPITFACDARTARTWEFVFTHAHPMNVAFVRFHTQARLNNWEGLGGWVLRGLVKRPAPKQEAAAYVRADQVLDLTEKFRDGKLAWTPPAGSWTILRIGHVNNGSRNGPAPAEATGWECNKMDRHAIDVHFAAYIGRLAKGPLAGGKLKGFVVDSWECRRQTWTGSLEADFRAANGYDFRRKLPAVFGWVLDDPAATERFLLDWRRTLGELVERNYYARMNELARSMGMTAQYETAFGDVLPGDLMSFWKWCDTPMCEFWHPRTVDFVGQDDFKPVYPCASATHVYGKTRCAAESFTSMNLKWNEKLRDLKRTGNHALARGVTHLVFHTYTHNPRTDWLPPGTSFGHIIGTPFVRGQTWWGAMREFTDYFARCETLLEAGQPTSDVLWFLGDEVGHKPSETSPLPEGFKFDYCNPDALLTRVAVQDGRLVLPDGVSYSVLWVPTDTFVAPKSEAKIRALAAAGARIVRGGPAEAVAGLRPDVVAGPSARVAAEKPLEPPFEWIHRTARKGAAAGPVAARDWYFVSANGPEGYTGTVSFRATGGVELWDPVTGARRAAEVVATAGGRTTVAFDFACGESTFVVFTEGPAVGTRGTVPTGTPSPVTGWTLRFPQGWGAPASLALPELKSWTELPLGEEARHFSGTASYVATVTRAEAGVATLDLGRVESVATVFVNGAKVRTLWAPPYRCEIPLRAGANELRIDVTGTWFNRLAYDAGLPEKDRKTWTIAGPKKGAAPEVTGLLGPVTLTGASTVTADAAAPHVLVLGAAGAKPGLKELACALAGCVHLHAATPERLDASLAERTYDLVVLQGGSELTGCIGRVKAKNPRAKFFWFGARGWWSISAWGFEQVAGEAAAGAAAVRRLLGLDPVTEQERAAAAAAVRELGAKFPSYPAAALLKDLAGAATRADFEAQVRRALVRENPLVNAHEILYVTHAMWAPDHHNTANIFQCGEINQNSYRTQGALRALNAKTGAVRTLVTEKAGRTVRDPEVDFDGRRILFAMRDGREDDYHVYTIEAQGTNLRQLTRARGVSDISPVWLPDGDIVFSSTREPKYCMCNRHIMGNLFRMKADGANIHQIGKSTLFEGNPSVLADGRLLYDRWEYVDRDFGDAQGLWVCNPDGTRHAIHWGNNTTAPGGVVNARGLSNPSQVIAVLGSCHDMAWGALGLIDRSLGVDGQAPVLRTWPAAYRAKIHAGGREDFDSTRNLPVKYADPYPIDDGHFLAVRTMGRGTEMALVYLDLHGNEVVVHEEAPGCHAPVLLRAAKRPPVIETKRTWEHPHAPGRFYVQNVYVGTHMQGVKPGSVKALRVVESPEKRSWLPVRGWFGHGEEAAAMNWHSFENKRILGTVPVEQDGSAYFEVPANTYVYFQALDGEGKMVQSMRSGAYLQPGELYGCVGCHEDRVKDAPKTDVTPLAMRRAPSKLDGAYNLRGLEKGTTPHLYSFQREVQPVFTRNCVRCHDYGKPAGEKLNLSGDRGAYFCTSYVDLWAKGIVKCVGGGPAEIQPAYSWGAHASPLAKKLAGHGGAKLTEDERDRLVTWMDINAPYWPTYYCAFGENYGGRMPITRAEHDELERLTGVKIATGHSARQREQLDFERPDSSRILDSVRGKPAYEKARAILVAGQMRLKATPRADMEGFTPCAADLAREWRYQRRLEEETRAYDAIRTGRLIYDR